MLIGREDKWFGGERGAAQRALDAMRKTYGPAKGEQVYRATIIKRERKAKRPRKR